MHKLIVMLVMVIALVLFAAGLALAEEVVRVEVSSDHFAVGVDPIALFDAAKEISSKTDTAYEEKIIWPNRAGVYADASDGVLDVPQVQIQEHKPIEKSTMAKLGEWCWQNRGKVAAGAGAAVGAGLIYQYQNDGWPFQSNDDDAGEPRQVYADGSTEANGPIIVVSPVGDGNTTTINISTETSEE